MSPFAVGICVWLRFVEIVEYLKTTSSYHPHSRLFLAANWFLLLLGFVSALGVSMVANFQVSFRCLFALALRKL